MLRNRVLLAKKLILFSKAEVAIAGSTFATNIYHASMLKTGYKIATLTILWDKNCLFISSSVWYNLFFLAGHREQFIIFLNLFKMLLLNDIFNFVQF